MGQAYSTAPVPEPIPLCQVCMTEIEPLTAKSPDGTKTSLDVSKIALCCRMKHYLCRECAEQYIKVTWMAKPVDVGVVPELECSAENCGIVFREHQIARIVEEETFQMYLDKKMTARDGMILANMRQELSSLSPEELQDRAEIDRQVLAKQLKAQFGATTTAYSCPQCNFGPIMIEGCWDLRSHHNQTRADGSQTNNACPQCKFYTHDRNRWNTWDGQVRDVNSFKKKQKENENIFHRSLIVGIVAGWLFVAFKSFWVAIFALIIGLMVRALAESIDKKAALKSEAQNRKTQ